ncbi:MAG: hypothetical protein ACRDRP_04380 [Pseudonocardiaceae bacterium]
MKRRLAARPVTSRIRAGRRFCRQNPVSTPGETYRATMQVQTPEHGPATLIIPRQGSRTWLMLDGSIRTTAVLTGQLVSELTSKLHTSAHPRITNAPAPH